MGWCDDKVPGAHRLAGMQVWARAEATKVHSTFEEAVVWCG